MTLPSRHTIRNSGPGSLRPSTLPLGHGDSPQYWIFTKHFVSLKFGGQSGVRARNLRLPKQAALTTAGGGAFARNNFKAAPGDDISFHLYFCNVVVYYVSYIWWLFFSEFSDLKKYFLLTFLWIRLKLKQTFCIPKHLLKDVLKDTD